MMTAKKRKALDMVKQFAALARECNRRGDVTGRNQAEQSIRETAPNLRYAENVIGKLYTK